MTGRRKRPHVPEERRKRVARACNACRKLKEKCEGGFPCMRCTRLHRSCESVRNPTSTGTNPCSELSQSADVHLFDSNRVETLERIVRHYTGIADLDNTTLVQITRSLRSQGQQADERPQPTNEALNDSTDDENGEEECTIELVSSTTGVYTGALSHHEFSNHVQRKLNEGLLCTDNEQEIRAVHKSTDLSRASRLHTRPSTIIEAATAFPPLEVANFLFEIFFEYAQTNYYYVDEQSLRQKLDSFYSYPKPLCPENASWLCTLLMLFATGTQFAHLTSRDRQDDVSRTSDLDKTGVPSPDDDAALGFYHAAITLIPDVMSLASIESVQAFLLLGVYTLPVDAAGLSFTYFGIAVRMAIQNGMHRKCDKGMDARTVELRNRIWWTTYSLEKRVCVLHGWPVSVSKSDVDAAQPSDFPALRAKHRIDTLPNILAMIKLTTTLEEASSTISHLKKASKKSRLSVLASTWQLKQDLHEYWQTLPTKTYCRDLAPDGSLFRFNVHLALTYHLAHVFIGRSFIFVSPRTTSPYAVPTQDNPQWAENLTSVVSGCVKSAVEIIDLCQTLQDEVGLARASYTEFTSCWAALLVILAQRLREPSTRLRKASEQGIKLLKHMSVGFYSADTEKSTVEAIETAIRRLEKGNQDQGSEKASPYGGMDSAYNRFRNWATLWKNEGVNRPAVVSSSSAISMEFPAPLEPESFSALSPLQNFGWGTFLPPFLIESGEDLDFSWFNI